MTFLRKVCIFVISDQYQTNRPISVLQCTIIRIIHTKELYVLYAYYANYSLA